MSYGPNAINVISAKVTIDTTNTVVDVREECDSRSPSQGGWVLYNKGTSDIWISWDPSIDAAVDHVNQTWIQAGTLMAYPDFSNWKFNAIADGGPSDLRFEITVLAN